MKSIICFTFLLGSSLFAYAAEECKVAPVSDTPAEQIRWQGPCKDGWADGIGVLETKRQGEKGWRYEGPVERGLAHGHGYMKMAAGHQYEGGFAEGLRDGIGVYLYRNGDRYDGSFKQDRRHGRGSMSYTKGGRYDGDWKDDKYNGRGQVEYPGGRKLLTTFVDGWPAGQAKPEVPEERFKLLQVQASTGTTVRRPIVTNSFPVDKSYEQMTAVERNGVKAAYPLMDDADEPPFPVKSMETLYRGLVDILCLRGDPGSLSILVMIDSEGTPVSANVYDTPDPSVGKAAAQLLMLAKYKPARCAGKPCAMVFPVQIN